MILTDIILAGNICNWRHINKICFLITYVILSDNILSDNMLFDNMSSDYVT
jgi:hypothetical protein